MSAFLGSVHHWMYGKIQLQEELTACLLAISLDSTLAGRLDKEYGSVDTRPLEEIIDQSDIHGWLNHRVQLAEERFATVVEALLEQSSGELAPLMNIARNFGGKHAIQGNTEVAEAYQKIDGLLLDGMPCDGGRQVVSEDENELVFMYETSLHALCHRSNLGIEAFAALRQSMLDGVLDESGLKLETLGNGTCRIIKEG